MRLSTLLASLLPVSPAFDCELSGLAQDSRLVQPGCLFLACRGRTFDGRRYIDEAVAKGARAVLAETEQALPSWEWRQQVPVLHLPGLSMQLAALAALFFNEPAKKLPLIGVTGTNGKTSTTHFIAQALAFLQRPCALIGTLGNGFPGALQETLMTTPDTVTLQKLFADFCSRQAAYLAMEVSSHSLDQERIKGLAFEVAVFTNLTQDHLDYHGSMQAYGAAKKRFFTDYPLRQAVINADDAFGQALLAELPRDRVLAYSARGTVPGLPTVFVEEADFDWSGLRARVATPWGRGAFFAPVLGEFNLSNVLAVLATLGALGLPFPEVLDSLAQLKPVPGRMQVLGGFEQPRVVVDYSHTPDALEKALRALRKHCQGKLLCLMGCGGDRDKGKRPLMGAIAERYADAVFLTNDNPRHECPEAIIADILGGLNHPQQARVELSRSQAIQDIIQSAAPGDYVLVAGKGAETEQQVGDEKIPFSDLLRVAEVLAVSRSSERIQ